MYAFFNNAFLPVEKAVLHISDLSIQRGYGIFDFFKMVNGKTPFLDDYINRFFQSAEQLLLPVALSHEELKQIALELLQRNGETDAGVKLLLTGGYSSDGYTPGTPNLVITQSTLPMVPDKIIEQGVPIITHSFRRELPRVKSINYTTGILQQQKVKEANAYDVLYQLQGEISEFPRSNIFIVTKEGTILTPADHVLSGITRQQILRMSSKAGIQTGKVTMDDLLQAQEAFLASTTKRILPIVTVDGHTIGTGKPGPITIDLLEQLKALELR